MTDEKQENTGKSQSGRPTQIHCNGVPADPQFCHVYLFSQFIGSRSAGND